MLWPHICERSAPCPYIYCNWTLDVYCSKWRSWLLRRCQNITQDNHYYILRHYCNVRPLWGRRAIALLVTSLCSSQCDHWPLAPRPVMTHHRKKGERPRKITSMGMGSTSQDVSREGWRVEGYLEMGQTKRGGEERGRGGEALRFLYYFRIQ